MGHLKSTPFRLNIVCMLLPEDYCAGYYTPSSVSRILEKCVLRLKPEMTPIETFRMLIPKILVLFFTYFYNP